LSTPVDLKELLEALAWVSGAESATLDAEVFVRRADGRIVWVGEGIDDDPPADLEDDSAYVTLPHKHDLDLGRDLVFRFVEEQLPGLLGRVQGFFRKRGAYAQFKELLHAEGKLQAWYDYEERAGEAALAAWCEENGFVATRGR
jgi:hypothetical protein